MVLHSVSSVPLLSWVSIYDEQSSPVVQSYGDAKRYFSKWRGANDMQRKVTADVHSRYPTPVVWSEEMRAKER